MASDGVHSVTLDEAIAAMRMTADGMSKSILYPLGSCLLKLRRLRHEPQVQGNELGWTRYHSPDSFDFSRMVRNFVNSL